MRRESVRSAAAVPDRCIDSGSAAEMDDKPLVRRRVTLDAVTTALAVGLGSDGRLQGRRPQRLSGRFGRCATRAAVRGAHRRGHRVGDRHARYRSRPLARSASAGGDPSQTGGWAIAR